MEKDVVFAINYALNKGFQIHPDALKILERVDVNELERVIKEIVQEKYKQKFILINIIIPDIPEHIPNRSKTETCAAFLSDLHIGSMYFMEKELNDFISWLSSPV